MACAPAFQLSSSPLRPGFPCSQSAFGARARRLAPTAHYDSQSVPVFFSSLPLLFPHSGFDALSSLLPPCAPLRPLSWPPLFPPPGFIQHALRTGLTQPLHVGRAHCHLLTFALNLQVSHQSSHVPQSRTPILWIEHSIHTHHSALHPASLSVPPAPLFAFFPLSSCRPGGPLSRIRPATPLFGRSFLAPPSFPSALMVPFLRSPAPPIRFPAVPPRPPLRDNDGVLFRE